MLAVLPASDFNRLPTFEEQVHDVPVEDLRALGELFIKYHMHHDFHIGLLHRHFRLREGQLMLHCPQNNDADLCFPFEPRDCDFAELAPHAFFLAQQSSFRPFEYRLGRPLSVPQPGFLAELKRFLVSKHLDSALSLVERSTWKPAGVQALEVQSTEGSLSFTQPTSQIPSGSNAITTEWSFAVDAAGRLEITEEQKCVKDPSTGIHEAK